MTLTYKYWHGGDWCGIYMISLYQSSIYNHTSSRLIAINKLQRFICDKKQNSVIGIWYNNECLIQNCDENNRAIYTMKNKTRLT